MFLCAGLNEIFISFELFFDLHQPIREISVSNSCFVNYSEGW